jgi:16S rRNA pseudouridine516 synthase
MRLDRILANLGYGSRRAVRALLDEGRIRVCGTPEKNGAVKVSAGEVTLDGEPLDHSAGIFIALHKPAGYACSHDPREAPLMYDLLPARWMRRNPPISSIGRLDRDTTGILLITDQTHLTHALASPAAALEKVYLAELDPDGPELDPGAPMQGYPGIVSLFASGTLRLAASEAKPCLPAELTLTGKRSARLVLREGRFHQVKRMFAACGYRVTSLHRESFGHYALDGLQPGDWRDEAIPEQDKCES